MTAMVIHQVEQGTQAWHSLRLQHFTASEAPAMMGISKYQTRTELLNLKATGLAPEVDDATQRRFDDGHRTEAMARPLVEAMIGDELYPVVATKGNLLASMDGMTMLGDTLFEHKALNQELVAAIAAFKAGDIEALDPHYWVQMEQQLHVSDAERVIFTCSDGTEENLHWLEYRPVPGRIEQILAGWKQFEQDLATHVPSVTKPKAEAQAIKELPALAVQLVGEVKQSNLALYRGEVQTFIASISTDLKTDQDFANAEAAVKFLKKAEDQLEVVRKQAISQTASIDEMLRSFDAIGETLRKKRLELDKLVKAKKEEIRLSIKQQADTAFAKHIATINARLAVVQLPPIYPDFAGAMKGKRNLDSLQDAVDSELARAKVDATQAGEAIEANLTLLRERGAGHEHLFADIQQLVLKSPDDLLAIIKARIGEHLKALAEAEAAKPAKCDGNHGGPRCADPECWNNEEPEGPMPLEHDVDGWKTADIEDGIQAADAGQLAPLEAVKARYATAEPDAADNWRAEVFDLMHLVQAVAAGIAPLSVLQVDPVGLHEAIRANSGTHAFPGVNLVKA